MSQVYLHNMPSEDIKGILSLLSNSRRDYYLISRVRYDLKTNILYISSGILEIYMAMTYKNGNKCPGRRRALDV